MTVLQTIAVAFAMFSGCAGAAVRLERKEYAVRAVRLPAGGAGVRRTVVRVRRAACCLPAARAAGFCLVPVWVTGGIHLDGYADTCDALSSYGEPRKEAGNFKGPALPARSRSSGCAAILRLILRCAAVRQLHPAGRRAWTLALVLERALSGLAVAAVPAGKKHRPCPHLRHGGGPRPRAAGAGRALRRAGRGALRCTGRLGGGALAAGALLFARYHRCCRKAVWRRDR